MRPRILPPAACPLLLLALSLAPGPARPDEVQHDAGSPLSGMPAETLPADRSEVERDRLEAATRAAWGRLQFQRGEYLAALRSYQRASRYDPRLLDPLRDIVPLAFSLNRGSEATRYAVLAAEDTSTDPRLLEQLGDYLAARGELPRAARFYQRALRFLGEGERQPPPDDTPGRSGQAGRELAARTLGLWNKLGRLWFAAGEFPRSARAFDRLLPLLDAQAENRSPDKQVAQLLEAAEQVYRLAAEAYLQAGRWDDAERLFRRAEQTSSPGQPPRLEYHLARVAVGRQDWSAAREHWNNYWAEPISTGNDGPYRLLLDLLRRETGAEQAARKQAIEVLEKRLPQAPTDAVLADFVAGLHLDAGQLERAGRIYQAAAEGNPQPAPAVLTGLARVALRQDDVKQVLEALGRLVAAGQSLQSVAGPLRQLIESPPRCQALLDEARRQAAAGDLTPGAGLTAGRIAIESDQLESAENLFETVLQAEDPGPSAVFSRWAMSLSGAGKYDAAANVLRRGLRQDVFGDRAAEVYHLLAGSLALAGRTEDALRAAKRAAALEPDSAEYQSRIAWILDQAGREMEAEQAYRKLLDRWDRDASDATRQVLRRARLTLSHLCLKQDRVEEAVEWLEQVLDEFPEDSGALNDLGYLWVDRNEHLERSLRMLRRAVAAEPKNSSYRDSLGWAYYRLQRYEAALRELRQAVQDAGTDGVILDHLGDVHWALKHREQALSAWQAARDAFARDGEDKLRGAVESKLRERQAPDGGASSPPTP